MDNVPYSEWAQYIRGLLLESGTEDGIVLDLGCGTGSLTELLEKLNCSTSDSAAPVRRVDPRSEAKMTAARDGIVERICRQRPRFVVAFDNVSFSGNTMHVVVPTQALRDDMMSVRSEIVSAVAETAGVDGDVELEIEVREREVKLRPVRLEDRLRHIEEHTPLFGELKKSLDLDVE